MKEPSSSERGETLPRLLRDREGALRWGAFCRIAEEQPGIPIQKLSEQHYDYRTAVDRTLRELKACVTSHPDETARQVARLALKRYSRAQERRRGVVPRDVLDGMRDVLGDDLNEKDRESK